MPIHSPGPRLLSSVPFKHLGGKGQHGRKSVLASLNLTALVDMMTMLVVFLLMTFSATGEILMVQKGLTLPDAAQKEELKRAPIVCITADAITFNGEPMADPRTLAADTSMEWKIVELYERLKDQFDKGLDLRLELMHRDAQREGKTLVGPPAERNRQIR